jgi:excisionase family DNA binding protein
VSEDAPEYLSVREAARRLRIHENTLRNWVRVGIVTPIRRGRLQRPSFLASDIQQLNDTVPPISKPLPPVRRKRAIVDEITPTEIQELTAAILQLSAEIHNLAGAVKE